MSDNLGTIGFGFDSSELEKGQRAFAGLGDAAKRSADVLDRTQQSADRVRQASANTATAVDRQAQAMQASARAAQSATQAQAAGAQQAAAGMQTLADRTKTASQQMIDKLSQIGQSGGASFGELQRHVASLASTLGVGSAGGGLSGVIGSVTGNMARLLGAMGPVGTIVGLGATAMLGFASAAIATQVQLAKVQDRFALYEARAKLVTGSTLDARNAIDQLTATSIRSGVSLDSTLDVFTRFIRLRNELGASTRDITTFTETVQRIGIVSGATTQETAAGLQQLAQALAAGRLSGDELRSILENMPAIARILADGFGVSVGQLRAMGAEGRLTSDRVFGAILAAQGKVEREFEKMPKTAERAFQSVADQGTQLAKSLGDRFSSSEFVQRIAGGLQAALKGAADLAKPPSLQEQLKDLDSQIAAFTARSAETTGQALRRSLSEAFSSPGGFIQGTVSGAQPGDVIAKALGLDRAGDFQQVNKLLADRAVLQKQIADQQREQAEGRIAQGNAAALLPVTRAIELEKQLNDNAKKREEILKNIQQAENAIANLRAPEMGALMSAEDRNRTLKTQQTALIALQAELANTGTEYDKLARKVAESSRAVNAAQGDKQFGATNAQLDFLSKANELVKKSALDFKPIDIGKAINLLLDEQAVKVKATSNEYQRQIALIELQAQAIGKTRDEALALEGDVEVMKQFASILSAGDEPTNRRLSAAITEAVNAMTDLKRAEDALASGRQRQENQDYYARESAGLAALEKGAYAAARAMAEIDASIAERQRKGAGALGLQKFEFEQQIKAAQALFEDRERLKPLEIQLGTVGDARGRVLRERQAEIDRLVRDAPPSDDPIGGTTALRVAARSSEFATKDRIAAGEALASVREELEFAEKLLRAQSLSSQEYAIQVMLLEKQRDLKKQGVELTAGEQAQLEADTRVLARRNSQIEEQRKLAEQYRGIWQNAANGIQQAMSSAFEDMLNTGKINSQTLSNMLTQTVNKIIAQMWSAMIFDPLIKGAQKALGLDVIPVGGGSPGSGRGGGGGGGFGSAFAGLGGVLQNVFAGNFGNLAGAFNSAAFISDVAAAEAIGITLPFMGGGKVRAGQRAIVGEVGPEVMVPFGGFRAGGGDVASKRAYVVGERGPEIMVPKESGYIVPNHQLRDYGMDRWIAGKRAMGGPVIAGLPYAVGEQGPEGFVSGQTSTRRSGQPVVVNFNVQTPNADGFRASQAQIMADLSRAVGRGTARNS